MVKPVFCLEFQYESLGYFPGTWQKYQSKVPYFSACCIWWPLSWSISTPVEWATFATYADPRLLVPFNSRIDIKGIRHLLGLSRRQQQGEKMKLCSPTWIHSLINILLCWDVFSTTSALTAGSAMPFHVSEHFMNCTKEIIITNCREYKFSIFSVYSIYIRAEGYSQ